jgi:hypothetical protein
VKKIFEEIKAERKRQDEKFGEQNYSLWNRFFDVGFCKTKEKFYREINKKEDFRFSWMSILLEEVYEAFSTKKIEKQRAEMIQVAAVAVAIIECIDRKTKKKEASNGQ